MAKNKKKKNILIVEDEAFLMELYKTRFAQEGFEVCEEINGTKVFEHVKTHPPDLVLLDIIMPETNGYEVLEKIKKNNETKKIPVLIFSNLAQDDEIKKGLELGAEDYFIKSNYTPTQIVNKVNTMIKKNEQGS